MGLSQSRLYYRHTTSDRNLIQGITELHIDMADYDLLLSKKESVPALCQTWLSFSSRDSVDVSHDEDSSQLERYQDETQEHHCRDHFSIRFVLWATAITTSIVGLLVVSIVMISRHMNVPEQCIVSTATSSVSTLDAESAFGLPTMISCPHQPSLQQQQNKECIFDPMLVAWIPVSLFLRPRFFWLDSGAQCHASPFIEYLVSIQS